MAMSEFGRVGRREHEALHRMQIDAEKRGTWCVEKAFVNAVRGKGPVTHTDFMTGVKYMERSDVDIQVHSAPGFRRSRRGTGHRGSGSLEWFAVLLGPLATGRKFPGPSPFALHGSGQFRTSFTSRIDTYVYRAYA